jgi:lycopene beta-cyclase
MNQPQLHPPFNAIPTVGLKQYDYIIAGAGCAGLSLLLRMIKSGSLTGKQVLLIDREPKQKNDRTWCFWDKGINFFEPIVYKSWERIVFRGNDFSKEFPIAPYRYKMIRGIDFYAYCFSVIEKQPNITIQYGMVEKMETSEAGALLRVDNEIIKARYVFNSIIFEKPLLKKNEHYLLQHFKGWVIETAEPIFDDHIATLMDFNVDQQYGTAFVYIMPFSSKKALVEYTFFTKEQLKAELYTAGLKKYLGESLKGAAYTIKEEEFGVIPMTNYLFPGSEGNIINIGTAGGQTKASSGYTFQFIQKRTGFIVESLVATGNPFTKKGLTPGRFHFYDSVLLRLLHNKSLGGDIIFTRLFQENPATSIFKFLDNETSWAEDISIIKSLPAFPFAKAAIAQLFG